MTIRASQVLPVYPLSEDVQPGDVFVVQMPLSQQTAIYNKKGFLPLDQLVTRLRDFDYGLFYTNAYWKGSYGAVPQDRPGSVGGATNQSVIAPRVAFPSYNFSVEKGAGLRLAIPISGVPVGLGYMGASKASGSVSLTDAYTYGIDIEPAARNLWNWWNTNLEVQKMMTAVARSSSEPVYLRCINRVFIVRNIDVRMSNLDSQSGGVDVGVAQDVKLPDLSGQNAAEIKASTEAYKAALESLSSVVGELKENMPGGSFRFTQVSQRSVNLTQKFERPLVIGYLGFDVKVFPDGRLSPPIPSYAVLNKDVEVDMREPLDFAIGEYDEDYAAWLPKNDHRDQMVAWLKANDIDADPADLYGSPKFHNTLLRADDEFKFSTPDSDEENGD